MIFPWHLYLMAFIYFIAGANHFRNSKMYIKIIPSYFPNPKLLNKLSGAIEISLAVGLIIPSLSRIAAWGTIALLLAIYPVHFYMLNNNKVNFGLPNWVLILRILLQIPLMFWAYQYT